MDETPIYVLLVVILLLAMGFIWKNRHNAAGNFGESSTGGGDWDFDVGDGDGDGGGD